MDREKALQYWNEIFLDKVKTKDYNGQEIEKEEYETDKETSWTIDFLRPLEAGGEDNESNYLISSKITKEERKGRNSFKLNERNYQIRKEDLNYFLFDVTDRKNQIKIDYKEKEVDPLDELKEKIHEQERIISIIVKKNEELENQLNNNANNNVVNIENDDKDKKIKELEEEIKLIKDNSPQQVNSENNNIDYLNINNLLTKLNKEKEKKIYLFIKVCGISNSQALKKDEEEFFKLIEETSKSYLKEDISNFKYDHDSSFLLLMFNIKNNNVYKQILKYAALVNSYRVYYREQNKLDGYIVLDEVEMPILSEYMSFDKSIITSKSLSMMALKQTFTMSLVDSSIDKGLHIGSEILPNLDIDNNRLEDSSLASGNFVKLYGMKEEFKKYNALFKLKKEN